MRYDFETFGVMMENNGWENHYFQPIPSSDKIYALNGFTAYFNNYYIVVTGQMPIKKAQELYNSVDKSLEIRANGHGGNIFPEKVRHKKIMKELNKHFGKSNTSISELVAIEQKIKQELTVSDPDGFFIETYHIDTWEGFAIFSKFIVDNDIHSTWFD